MAERGLPLSCVSICSVLHGAKIGIGEGHLLQVDHPFLLLQDALKDVPMSHSPKPSVCPACVNLSGQSKDFSESARYLMCTFDEGKHVIAI